MLEIDHIQVLIGEAQILQDVFLSVQRGQKVGLIGPNGHGKSTTLMTISGLYPPRRGNITFEGRSLIALGPRRIVELGLTLVPEGGHLFPEMTVLENLLLGAYTAEAWKCRKDSLERVYSIFPRLKELRNHRCNSLSGGELRMTAVGRGIMTAPKLLMLDEPTLGLAPNLVEDMGQKLSEIGKMGTSIILADENIDLISEFTERVYFIENGQIKLEGSTAQVLESEYVKRTYIGIE